MMNSSIDTGWLRDLTRECVEPNPGPLTLAEIISKLNTRLGTDEAESFKALIDVFLVSIKAEKGSMGLDGSDVLDFIKNRDKMTTIFGNEKYAGYITALLTEIVQVPQNTMNSAAPAVVENSRQIVHTIILEAVPPEIRGDLNYPDDCWVIRPSPSPGVQTPAPIIPYIGKAFVESSVHSWVNGLYIPGYQEKQVLVVDGNVKSGKTVTAKYVIPLVLTRYPLFAQARAVYVELLELAYIGGLANKEEGFCRLVAQAFRANGVIGLPSSNIADLSYALKSLINVYVVTIDEYHFLYSKLSADECDTLGVRIKNLLLGNHNAHFIVTASTQPLLWSSLDKSRPNGINLLANPIVITTSRNSPLNWVRDTVTLVNALAHTSFDITDASLARNCATQAQILVVMNLESQPSQNEARSVVSLLKQGTYWRDIQAFYSDSRATMDILLSLAVGTQARNLLGLSLGPRAKGWIINSTADGLCYLADRELAVTLQTYFSFGGDHPSIADRNLLYELIPLASAIDRRGEVVVESCDELQLDTADFWGAWEFLINCPVNAASVNVIPNWANFFRLSRNIYCHDTSTDNYTSQLAEVFVRLFKGRRYVHECFVKLLLPLGFV